jgi:hypothetical protein
LDTAGRYLDDLWSLSLGGLAAGTAGSLANAAQGAGGTVDDTGLDAVRAESAALCGWQGLGAGAGAPVSAAGTGAGIGPVGSTVEAAWRSSCGSVDAASQPVGSPCTLEALLLRAWCAGEYQSLASI